MTPSDWPWQHSFPPFFTIQPNVETRKKQLEAWSDLVLKYHRVNRSYTLDIRDCTSSPLFSNSSIRRVLSSDGITTVLNALMQTGNAEPVDKSKTRWFIYWHTLDEWASLIYSWAQGNNQVGTVCTFYEIVNDDSAEFYGIDERVLIKSLRILESKNMAEIIMSDDDKGVKFF